jgi:hypothetical protein
MLDRNELWNRASMGLCLYLYEDELPELEALAGGQMAKLDPTATAQMIIMTGYTVDPWALRDLHPEGRMRVRILPARKKLA